MFFAITAGMGADVPLVAALSALLGILIFVVVLLRFGLLMIGVAFAISSLLNNYPLMLNLSGWCTGNAIVATLSVLAVAAYGFYTSLAGRPLFGDETFEH